MTIAPERSAVRTHFARLEIAPETRSKDGTMRIGGTAVVYDAPSPAENLPWRETFRRGAFRDVLANPETDLLLLIGHDRNRPLARQSAGNLSVRDTSRGLEFTAELVDTSDGRDAYELLQKRVVKGCSFAFLPDPAGEEWEFRDGEEWCTVTRVARLFELTLTADPVYTQTDAEPRSVVEAMRRRQRAAREPSPYGPGSPQSWFHDLYRVSLARHNEERTRAWRRLDEAPPLDSLVPIRVSANRDRGSVEQAAERLDNSRKVEARDVGTGAFAGFTPTAVPGKIADRFVAKARAAAVLAGALRQEPLPAAGMTLSGTRLTTGASVEIAATENTGPTEVDPVGASVTSPVSLIWGFVDVSRQALERSTPDFDTGLAGELGRALGAKLDEALLSGAGTGLALRGLINVSGITSVAYTDATPTQAESWPKIMEAYSTASTALGDTLDRVVLHSRRWSWFANWKDANGVLVRPEWPGQVVVCNSIPTNLGAGTNEDYLLLLASDELPIYLGSPSIRFLEDGPGHPQTIRVVAEMYVAALFGTRPEAIAQVAGTGFAGVAFS